LLEVLKGKKVLVTGASTGIGAEIARLFASYGASVGIHYYRSEKEAKSVLYYSKRKGVKAELFKGDLLREEVRRGLIRSFVDVFGGIDILVNNAGGIYGSDHFLEMDEQSWDDTFGVNVKAPFFLAKNAFLAMKEQGGGKIINISSVAAKYGGSVHSLHYGAAKAALDALTVGLARAGADYNILVNSVRAGVVDTGFHKKIGRNKDDMKRRIELTPLKRIGKPIDVARMVVFLASNAGDYITGEVFTIAGGD